MGNIFFDLDGVIRELRDKTLTPDDPKTYYTTIKGKTFYEILDTNRTLLYTAKPTEYYPLISKIKELVILSSHPEKWRPYTTKWILKYLPFASVIYVSNPEEKLKYLGKDDLLIEDFPHYKDYSNIILIDREYNQETKAPFRIYDPDELAVFFMENVPEIEYR